MNQYIQLNRKFSPITPKQNLDVGNLDYSLTTAYGEEKTWDDLLAEYRCVILAEAGAGKTKEFEECSKRIQAQGKYSFFIRIEDIDNEFVDAFEVGDESLFDEWLDSADPAWFFLDSIDEARLKDPKQFEKAIRKFAKKVKPAARRCHIYISSRPYSWGFESDENFLDKELYYGITDNQDESNREEKVKSALKVFSLSPLNLDDIEIFCEIRSVENIPGLLNQIERYDLLGLAERPFDLDNIIDKWRKDSVLGSRTEIIEHNIKQRLTDRHTRSRRILNITLEKLQDGAQRLAAAVILTRKANINVPNSNLNIDNIDPIEILPDWTREEILALLGCGIFNDIVYDAVRFRHRDIREFLAAQWFIKLLRGDNRLEIESLFFREQFGERIVTPTLRCVLPWIILEDQQTCDHVLKNQPEIAFEGGDPSQLTLDTRKKIFVNFVERIANNLDNRTVRDNDSIAKISNKDLEENVLELIQKYSANEDAIFFLGRMVWQGQLDKCVPALIDIALDQANGMYARRIATRAVMSCGSEQQRKQLWKALNASGEILERRLIVELVSEIDQPDVEFISLVIDSLKNSETYQKYEYSGLSRALQKLIEKCNEQLKFDFLLGLIGLLHIQPYVDKKNCKISEKYGWCLKLAYKIIEQLIALRSQFMLETSVLELLVQGQRLIHYNDYDENEEKNNLSKLIPQWSKLNEALYCKTIEIARQDHKQSKNEELTDDWQYCYYGQFWQFDSENFERLLQFILLKQTDAEKIIVLNRAYYIYTRENKPSWMFENLQQAIEGNSVLTNRLKELVSPFINEDFLKYEREEQDRKTEIDNELIERTTARKQWMQSLQHDPQCLFTSSNYLEGHLTNDICWLMQEFKNPEISTKRDGYADWKQLTPEFGEEVSFAYREAAIKFWRIYKPSLYSEEEIEKNSTPYAVIFGLAGLEIEASEEQNFPHNLTRDELLHALRYLNWELNGFPTWLEKMYQAFPNDVIDAVMKEVNWELQQSNADNKENYNHIIHDLLFYAPWIHDAIAPQIYQWFVSNTKNIHHDTAKYLLQILLNSELESEKYFELAKGRINEAKSIRDRAWWFALLVDSNPEIGINDFKAWLKSLDLEDSKYAAQIFVCHLLGERDSINGRAGKDEYKKIKNLKALYSLVNRYVKHEEDIHRAGSGVYSPGLRDHAQDARDKLFKFLQNTPTSESYYALKELASLEIDPNRKSWLNKLATHIAVTCGDIEPFKLDSVLELENSRNINPTSHKMLFDLALLKILKLKDWLENGDDSPYQVWKLAQDETAVRNLIAGWLRQESNHKYVISQENELANAQRPDIRFENTNVASPVPTELKLLDKGWSGPNLCERLRNQLVGDYLREINAGCGIFLLVAQNCNKKWDINGELTCLEDLEDALDGYWQGIAKDWPSIDTIKVIVIDLNKRSRVSST
ncbi:NACHT domain-containing protein [Acinetobacter kookii]